MAAATPAVAPAAPAVAAAPAPKRRRTGAAAAGPADSAVADQVEAEAERLVRLSTITKGQALMGQAVTDNVCKRLCGEHQAPPARRSGAVFAREKAQAVAIERGHRRVGVIQVDLAGVAEPARSQLLELPARQQALFEEAKALTPFACQYIKVARQLRKRYGRRAEVLGAEVAVIHVQRREKAASKGLSATAFLAHVLDQDTTVLAARGQKELRLEMIEEVSLGVVVRFLAPHLLQPILDLQDGGGYFAVRLLTGGVGGLRVLDRHLPLTLRVGEVLRFAGAYTFAHCGRRPSVYRLAVLDAMAEAAAAPRAIRRGLVTRLVQDRQACFRFSHTVVGRLEFQPGGGSSAPKAPCAIVPLTETLLDLEGAGAEPPPIDAGSLGLGQVQRGGQTLRGLSAVARAGTGDNKGRLQFTLVPPRTRGTVREATRAQPRADRAAQPAFRVGRVVKPAGAHGRDDNYFGVLRDDSDSDGGEADDEEARAAVAAAEEFSRFRTQASLRAAKRVTGGSLPRAAPRSKVSKRRANQRRRRKEAVSIFTLRHEVAGERAALKDCSDVALATALDAVGDAGDQATSRLDLVSRVRASQEKGMAEASAAAQAYRVRLECVRYRAACARVLQAGFGTALAGAVAEFLDGAGAGDASGGNGGAGDGLDAQQRLLDDLGGIGRAWAKPNLAASGGDDNVDEGTEEDGGEDIFVTLTTPLRLEDGASARPSDLAVSVAATLRNFVDRVGLDGLVRFMLPPLVIHQKGLAGIEGHRDRAGLVAQVLDGVALRALQGLEFNFRALIAALGHEKVPARATRPASVTTIRTRLAQADDEADAEELVDEQEDEQEEVDATPPEPGALNGAPVLSTVASRVCERARRVLGLPGDAGGLQALFDHFFEDLFDVAVAHGDDAQAATARLRQHISAVRATHRLGRTYEILAPVHLGLYRAQNGAFFAVAGDKLVPAPSDALSLAARALLPVQTAAPRRTSRRAAAPPVMDPDGAAMTLIGMFEAKQTAAHLLWTAYSRAVTLACKLQRLANDDNRSIALTSGKFQRLPKSYEMVPSSSRVLPRCRHGRWQIS